jgi:hypothetical protein
MSFWICESAYCCSNCFQRLCSRHFHMQLLKKSLQLNYVHAEPHSSACIISCGMTGHGLIFPLFCWNIMHHGSHSTPSIINFIHWWSRSPLFHPEILIAPMSSADNCLNLKFIHCLHLSFGPMPLFVSPASLGAPWGHSHWTPSLIRLLFVLQSPCKVFRFTRFSVCSCACKSSTHLLYCSLRHIHLASFRGVGEYFTWSPRC